jgi:hypothetical protein
MHRKRAKSSSENEITERCHWQNCGRPAPFKAPKSPKHLDEYNWYCETHITEFNKNWNYFKDFSEEQLEDFRVSAILGHRPTWKFGIGGNQGMLDLESAFARYTNWQADSTSGVGKAEFPKPEAVIKLTASQRKSLTVFGLDQPPESAIVLKQLYKSLVKRYHPDINKGDQKAEDRFKELGQAYKILQEIFKQP